MLIPPALRRLAAPAVLLAVCLVVFWFRLGRLGLIDPDEPFYALTAREMIEAGDWMTPRIFGHPQFEKPIFFYWLTIGSFTVLGENELAARVPSTLFATLLVFLTWRFAVRELGARPGFLAALVLATGGAYTGIARMMLTDSTFAFFVCAACFAWWRALSEPASAPRALAVAGVASGFAVLTKGPLGLLVPALTGLAFRVASRRRLEASRAALAGAAVLHLVVAVPWYALMVHRFGVSYLESFFVHENIGRLLHAEHTLNNHIWYYPLVLAAGSIPWLPLLAATVARARGAAPSPLRLYLGMWLLTSLVFFTVCQSKLPTYIFFLFVPVALFAGTTLDELLAHGFGSRRERTAMLIAAVIQPLVLLGALAVPELSGAPVPVAATAGTLAAAALVLFVRGPSLSWIATSALALAVLVVTANTVALDAVEELTSVRPAAGEILRDTPPGEPVLCSAFLVRGVHFYTRRPPIVLATRSNPFYTLHAVPVVVGRAELNDFVLSHGASWCVLRSSDLHELVLEAADAPRAQRRQLGDRVILRLAKEDAR